jgi:hypothetical protein
VTDVTVTVIETLGDPKGWQRVQIRSTIPVYLPFQKQITDTQRDLDGIETVIISNAANKKDPCVIELIINGKVYDSSAIASEFVVRLQARLDVLRDEDAAALFGGIDKSQDALAVHSLTGDTDNRN